MIVTMCRRDNNDSAWSRSLTQVSKDMGMRAQTTTFCCWAEPKNRDLSKVVVLSCIGMPSQMSLLFVVSHELQSWECNRTKMRQHSAENG